MSEGGGEKLSGMREKRVQMHGKEFRLYSKCKVKPLEGSTLEKDLGPAVVWEG